MAYDPHKAHSDLVAAIGGLAVAKLGVRAQSADLEHNASYITDLTKLVANHIEALMADADASVGCRRISEEDARAIEDMGCDLAAQLTHAAEDERKARSAA